ncbi:MAG TPA: MBL fold metallo-hydrolase [Thermoanaerobaculia bacterium]|nr:MBL fold metallo-hydrolase [Thermoanaerobaculia bacterium]
MRRTFLFALLLAVAATTGFAQTDFSTVEVKVEKVAGSVYMLTGAGGNIGVSVGADGIVIVDDQFAPLAPKIKEALKSITDKPIRFILNTHYHGDHTGGNAIFGREGTIIAQDNVRKRLASGTTAHGNATPPAPKEALPVITFGETLTVHLNGENIRAVYLPGGHTDGDSAIFFTQSNVVHMGDDFFNGIFPFIDIENGGSVKGVIANGEKVLLTLPDNVKIIPGHGPLGDKAALRAFVTMLKGTSAAVSKALAAKKTAAQMKEEKILAPWDSWSKGFMSQDAFIDALVKDLSR